MENQSETEKLEQESIVAYAEIMEAAEGFEQSLDVDSHLKYLMRGMIKLSQNFTSLDASQPWLCFWILHSMDLLLYENDKWFEQQKYQMYIRAAIQKLKLCYNEIEGGFGGGPNQLPHLAPTYAATCALFTVCSNIEDFNFIDKKKLHDFLMSLKQSDGSFRMHQDGEVDVRGSYCAISVAKLFGILSDELKDNVADFIVQCQTYEGGIGGNIGSEAHGGYTFCALATLKILNQLDKLNLDSLKLWLRQRQMSIEGGFQGRCNKLVDSCYSYWQGAAFPLVFGNDQTRLIELNCNYQKMSDWIIQCAQVFTGGFTDRYERGSDYYHTCYSLSALSIAQEYANVNFQLTPIDPVYNITKRSIQRLQDDFNCEK